MKPSIGRCFKWVGEPFTAEDILVEIETEDRTIEVKVPVSGVLSQIFVKDAQFLTSQMPLDKAVDEPIVPCPEALFTSLRRSWPYISDLK